MNTTKLGLAAAILILFTVGPAAAEEPSRHSPTTRLIEKCRPATVALRVIGKDERTGTMNGNAGSGAIIHPAGYVLTNEHVVRHAERIVAVLADGRELPCRPIAHANYEDIAVVKIERGGPFPVVPLGRSHDLILGEPVLTIGNQALLRHTISTGIVSFIDRPYWTEELSMPDMLQAGMVSGPGVSGAPLINAMGEQIGVISSGRWSEGIVWAIPIDRVRRFLPRLLAIEDRFQYRLGLEVDMLGPAAKVTEVTSKSPAAQAGVQPGDIVRRIDDCTVRNGPDFSLALVDRHAGETLSIEFERAGKPITVKPVLEAVPASMPIENLAVQPGLDFAVFPGRWTKLPYFATLTPADKGRIERPSTAALLGHGDDFAMVLSGLLRVPADGMYVFNLLSIDGSRLYLGDRLVVDDDGQHPPGLVGGTGGIIRLKAGLHPFKLCYFSARQERRLAVFVQGLGIARQEIPASWFFAPEVKRESKP